jgi:hypothetical protein
MKFKGVDSLRVGDGIGALSVVNAPIQAKTILVKLNVVLLKVGQRFLDGC